MELKFSHKISEIGKQKWNRLCPDDNPFTRYEFLHALEESGAVSAKTGWQPLHLQLLDQGQLIAIMPLYLKNHSYGEYVFDWSWADAYHRYGVNYYPKLLNAIPFSPIDGPRILTQDSNPAITQLFAREIPRICEQTGAHSWHSLFIPATEKEIYPEQILIRLGCQYHWFNRNYRNFDDFLQSFTSRKRKNLRKERRAVQEQGITHIHLPGHEISDQQLDLFYDFYRLTYLKRGREAYLNKPFFYLLREAMPDSLLLVIALREETPVAAALSLQSENTLYGRYWGCAEEYDKLHFETCYYQGIEYCIEQGLQYFNSGAQGEHKIQRGFEPIPTWSAHWLEEKGFNHAIQAFVADEYHAMEQQIEDLRSYLPFKMV